MIAISIIIPMYNVAHFLPTCVQSVIDQHMKKHSFEVLMIDDGSPDESRSVAEGLAEKHTFIKVFSQKNKGLGGARNLGIKNAKGNYLIFLDADDVLIAEAIPDLLRISQDNDLDILEFGANQMDESGKVLATIAQSTAGEMYPGIAYYDRIKYMNSACNKLYSRDFILKHKLEFTEKIYREDFEFNTRSFFFAKRIMATDILGASFLQSSNSITRNKNQDKKDKYVADFVLILKLIQRFKEAHIQEKNTGSQENYFEERMAVSNLGLFYFMFKNNYSYVQMKNVRQDLMNEGLYRDDHKVGEKRREIFRRVMLKNFFLFGISQSLKRGTGL